jgi:site-specific DNA-methyltransferase (adenine-specific)
MLMRTDQCAFQRNVAQRGDALALLQSLPDCCTPFVIFDPQHRDNLDKLKYGNEGARQQERYLMPQMSSEFIDTCCRAAARVLSPSGYLLQWANAFQVCEGRHLRLADVLQCVDLIAWDNQRFKHGLSFAAQGRLFARVAEGADQSESHLARPRNSRSVGGEG